MKPFVLSGHERNITVVKFNYDGDLFFSGSAEPKINLWQAYTGQRLGNYTTKSAVKSLDIDINSQYLVSCGFSGNIEAFDVKTGKAIFSSSTGVKCKQVEFNAGSTKLMVLQDSYSPDEPSYLSIYDFQKMLKGDFIPRDEEGKIGENELDLKKVKPDINFALKISPEETVHKVTSKVLWYIDNESFFAAIESEVVRYSSQGQVVSKVQLHKDRIINSLAFSKDFSILVTAAGNGSKVIDPETMETLRFFKQEKTMNAVSVSPLYCSDKNPKYHLVMGGGVSARDAATTGGNAGFEAHVCNIMYGHEIGKIAGHFGPINSIEFFRDGRGFISGGEEGIIRVIRFPEAYFEEGSAQFE